MTTKATETKRPRRRLIKKIALGLLACVALGGVMLLWMVRSEPAHWKEHQAYLSTHSPQEIAQTAQTVEQRLLAFAKSLTGPQSAGAATIDDMEVVEEVAKEPVIRKMMLTQDEINAWITERFTEWLTYRDYDMPKQIKDPMVVVNKERLAMSFAYRSGGFEQVFTAGFMVTIRKDGKAVLALRDMAAGRLTIPAEGIGDYLREHAPDKGSASKVGEWLDKMHRVEFKPSMKIDGHKVHVMSYDVREDGVELTVKIDPK